jgi:hypothetical protein
MMRPGDVQNLIRFNSRMGMFICPSDRSNVVAFLHGYEYGTAGECRFTRILREHLAKRYRVKAGALGWPDQIARLAERRSLDWLAVYLLVSSEVLSAALRSTESNCEQAASADVGAIPLIQSQRLPRPQRR